MQSESKSKSKNKSKGKDKSIRKNPKIQLSDLKSLKQKSLNQNNEYVLEVGYYPIRGKAQVPRLLLQYLHISYVDRLFQLQEWNAFKNEQEASSWDFADMPFLIDRNPHNSEKYQKFIVTQAFPICQYILHKHNRSELLGKDISDKGIIQMYLWTIDTMGSIISINCSKKSSNESIEQFKQNQWNNNVLPRLQKYEKFVRNTIYTDQFGEQQQNVWFLGYFTIIDLSVYELVRYIGMLFPNRMQNLPKLKKIAEEVFKIPQINDYEDSTRAIKQMDPSILLKRLHKQ